MPLLPVGSGHWEHSISRILFQSAIHNNYCVLITQFACGQIVVRLAGGERIDGISDLENSKG